MPRHITINDPSDHLVEMLPSVELVHAETCEIVSPLSIICFSRPSIGVFDNECMLYTIYLEDYSDEAHFWLNGYVNKQNCRIWSEANPQVYVETPLHPEKLTVWCALWAGGILLQKR
ncbi:hypothetical protein TNCV_1635441 [Trichonephila clavipes]|nr:hypothetical protein TNCV_1635441 [Trichonephila clavipes]